MKNNKIIMVLALVFVSNLLHATTFDIEDLTGTIDSVSCSGQGRRTTQTFKLKDEENPEWGTEASISCDNPHTLSLWKKPEGVRLNPKKLIGISIKD